MFGKMLVPTVLGLLASLSSARIIGISVPETIKPGEGFNAIVQVENYIQSVADIAIVFGVIPVTIPAGSIGTVLGSYYLGPEQSNVIQNFSKWVTVPSTIATGDARLSGSLFSIYGAGGSPTLSLYGVNITVGDHTSTTYVSSLNN